MYKILKREQFSSVTYMWEVEAPEIAQAAQRFFTRTHRAVSQSLDSFYTLTRTSRK